MRDIVIAVKHRPVMGGENPKNQVAWEIDSARYEIIIEDQDISLQSIIKGVQIIYEREALKEKSRQHGNADSSKKDE